MAEDEALWPIARLAFLLRPALFAEEDETEIGVVFEALSLSAHRSEKSFLVLLWISEACLFRVLWVRDTGDIAVGRH